MDKEWSKKREESYQVQEKRAMEYFSELSHGVAAKTYASTLLEDLKIWEKQHVGKHSAVDFLMKRKNKPSRKNYHRYIKWLDGTKQLERFLDRSVAYIFIRDLGKSLTEADSGEKIERTKAFFKNKLISDKNELFRMESLFRLAQKEGIESSFIWLIEKVKNIQQVIPDGLDASEARRKLLKLIAGVLMHQLDHLPKDVTPDERREALDESIRLGYAYGLTYPFIDDLLDSDLLTAVEKKQYSAFIRSTLVTGEVPDMTQWTGSHPDFIGFIHTELKAGFEYIKEKQPEALRNRFFEEAYVFFEAQERDRLKTLDNPHYRNEEIFVPIILKSAFSRLIVRSIIGAPVDDGFHDRTFYYGIYNQLADDFTDMFMDLEAGAVTPYTYYLTYHEKRKDLLNPFELYWTVVTYLLHHVYDSDDVVREVMVSRAINSQQRFKKRIGDSSYEDLMAVIKPGEEDFWNHLQRLIQKAEDVDFLDKLIRDHMIANYGQEEEERDEFLAKIEELRIAINEFISVEDIPNATGLSANLEVPLAKAANYSLESGGKRLRPILTWFMGVEEFDLKEEALVPVLKSLEYMHTASLIFDDLPAQDNAEFRRGRPTLHEVYHTAMAEITGLYLTQKAVYEQTTLEAFDAKLVLKLIQYSSSTITEMCKGQLMDLESKNKQLTLEHLEAICFYKTGLAFEASLVMPAILAGKDAEEIATLKKYAYHAGIAFQIKDDLLDAESDEALLGKPTGQDIENETSTFVTVLGLEQAKIAMWEHYTLAAETLKQIKQRTNFLRHFLQYIVNRDS